MRERIVGAAVVSMLAGASGSVMAQHVTEWSSETRTQLAFRVNPEVLQRMLPPGWTSAPSTSPATPGANLTVTLMERSIVLDPQGRPLRNGTSRYVTIGAPARNGQGQTNTIVVGGISPEGEGVYGVYQPATTSRLERTTTGEAEQAARVQEHWAFASAGGDRVELRIAYRRGPVTKAHVDTIARSARRPEFQRTYRIDQAVDQVRGATGADRVEQMAVTIAGPMLASLFDGSEALAGVAAVPFYVREISIP